MITIKRSEGMITVKRCVAFYSINILMCFVLLVPIAAAEKPRNVVETTVEKEKLKARLMNKVEQDEVLKEKAKAIAKGRFATREGQSSEVVRAGKGTHKVLTLKHKVQWAEFSDTVGLFEISAEGKAQPLSGASLEAKLNNEIRKSAEAINGINEILSKERVQEILLECNQGLVVDVKELQPPFYNNKTGVTFYKYKNKLFYENVALLNNSENKCIRGQVDIQTGDLICEEIYCETE